MFRGGGENFAVSLSNALRALGHHTELFTLRPLIGSAAIPTPDEFSSVYILRSPWLSPITAFFHRYSMLRKLKGLRGIPRVLGQAIFEFRVFFALRKRKYDDLVLLSCGLPLIAYLTTRYLDRPGILRMPGPIENIYDLYFGKKSTAVLANGDAFDRIKKLGQLDNLHFLDIGVFDFRDVSDMEIADFRAALAIKEFERCILFVGRCIPIKNIPTLIRAWGMLSDSGYAGKLLIVGDGAELNRLRQLASFLGLGTKICFLGAKTKEELAVIYHAADCCVLPSRYDNFPNVLIEALSCGTPCIGTEVGGITKIISNDKNGILVKPDDVRELAAAIARVSVGTIDFDRARIKAVTREKYGWDKCAQSFISLVSNILKSKL